MRILPPKIIYIYEPAPPGPMQWSNMVGRRQFKTPPKIQNGLNMLMGLLATPNLDPAIKKKLEELLSKLTTLIMKINQIPSTGIRDMLFAKVEQIFQAIAKGELDIALDMTADVTQLTDRCAKLCDKIQNNIRQLRVGLDVQGPAGALLKAIGDAAQLAMNGASSAEDLEAIATMTDSAVEIGKKLEEVKPGSQEYVQLMNSLGTILDGLMSFDIKASEASAMVGDTNGIGQTPTARIRDGVGQLRQGTTDSLEQTKLDALERLLTEAAVAGKGGGEVAEAEAKKGMEDALRQASEGKLDEAIATANGTLSRLQQMKSLSSHLERRCHQLEKAGQGLKGPEKEAMEKLLENVEKKRCACKTPEEVHELDKQIEEALQAAQTCGCGPVSRSPGYAELLRLNREIAKQLEPIQAASGANAGGGANNGSGGSGSGSSGSSGSSGTGRRGAWGQDMFGPGAGSPRGNAGSGSAPAAGQGADQVIETIVVPSLEGLTVGDVLARPRSSEMEDPHVVKQVEAKVAELRQLAKQTAGAPAEALTTIAAAAEAAKKTCDGEGRKKLAETLEALTQKAAGLSALSPGSDEAEQAAKDLCGCQEAQDLLSGTGFSSGTAGAPSAPASAPSPQAGVGAPEAGHASGSSSDQKPQWMIEEDAMLAKRMEDELLAKIKVPEPPNAPPPVEACPA